MADAETIELDKPAGFIIVRQAADEVEILNLAVEPPLRRQGIARILVAEVIQWGHNSGARSIWLEVRESNAGANRFYKAVGFCVAGRRRNYYGEPAEDALVLTAPIPDA